MLKAGNYYTLRIARVSDFGLYLTDDAGDEVLLPNRYVSLENKVDDMIDVFVYLDSEERIVATTERPLARVGEVASLKVMDKTIHGVFLDWGLPKQLFVPNSNQTCRMEVGKYYPVYVYNDNVTGRVVGTMKLRGVINNNELTIRPREEVDIIVAEPNPLGFRVVVNGKHWGMIYNNQIFRPVKLGDRMKAYVIRITDDNRVDLSLQQQGYDEVKRAADGLLELLRSNGGMLPLWDGSDPGEIIRMTQMSKKSFKRTVGYLLKRGDIIMEEGRIRLRE